jgi:2-hydroxychromene-2-carboxylate isomerase
MLAVDFFWDPMCPWAWLTSRWVHEVIPLRDLDVDWRFISLRMVNEDKDYSSLPPGYERGHSIGLELLRVAAATREKEGAAAVGALYTAFGTAIHRERRRDEFNETGGAETVRALESVGLPGSLATAAGDESWDEAVRADTETALGRTGRDVGTPIITFGAPDGPSFFGPVISRIPAGEEAGRIWDAVSTIAHLNGFAEIKRSLRERPQIP